MNLPCPSESTDLVALEGQVQWPAVDLGQAPVAELATHQYRARSLLKPMLCCHTIWIHIHNLKS